MISLHAFIISVLALVWIPAQAEPITFGIVPQQSASTLAKKWVPICKYLSEKIGVEVRFATAPNIPEFEKRLENGQYDLAYMNPYHYVVFHDVSGYIALNKAKDKKIKGIMVKKKESSISKLSDLDGETLAFPAPAAFAASILTRSAFAEEGLNITPKYVSSHDSVYRNVALGIMPAGGGVVRTFKAVDPSIKDQLEIFWTTPGYTPHAIAHHPRVDSGLAMSIQKALIELHTTEEGKAILSKLKIKGFEIGINSDWDDVRQLKIDELK